jgi:hypothetical protein
MGVLRAPCERQLRHRAAEPIVAAWNEQGGPLVQHHTIEMADHSLVGHTRTVTDLITTWLTSLP